MRLNPLERCSASSSLDMKPSLLYNFFTLLPRLPSLHLNPRVSVLRQAPSLPFVFFLYLLVYYSFTPVINLPILMAKPSSAKNFFERARTKGCKNNKDSIDREEVKKEL
jgi:predicted neutral ceramidase superfamily lipid hydrolase